MDDLLNSILAWTIMALAVTACDRTAVDGPFLTCNPDRTACASSIKEVSR